MESHFEVLLVLERHNCIVDKGNLLGSLLLLKVVVLHLIENIEDTVELDGMDLV